MWNLWRFTCQIVFINSSGRLILGLSANNNLELIHTSDTRISIPNRLLYCSLIGAKFKMLPFPHLMLYHYTHLTSSLRMLRSLIQMISLCWIWKLRRRGSGDQDKKMLDESWAVDDSRQDCPMSLKSHSLTDAHFKKEQDCVEVNLSHSTHVCSQSHTPKRKHEGSQTWATHVNLFHFNGFCSKCS